MDVKIDPNDPPREYTVGRARAITIRDCGRVALEPDEQVTFITAAGGQYDVARKDWGFYATPSTNGRLASFGLRAAVVRNDQGRFYVMIVERGKEDAFARYLADEANRVVAWLDDESTLAAIERACSEFSPAVERQSR